MISRLNEITAGHSLVSFYIMLNIIWTNVFLSRFLFQVEEMMHSAVRDVIDGCLDTCSITPRNEWIQDWPSQVSIVILHDLRGTLERWAQKGWVWTWQLLLWAFDIIIVFCVPCFLHCNSQLSLHSIKYPAPGFEPPWHLVCKLKKR